MLVMVVIAAVAAIPLLWPQLPPLVDLLGHLGRYKVELDGASSPTLLQFYAFDWQLIGNLGADLLVVPLAPVFGLELSVKLIAIAVPVLSTLGLLWIAREVHGSTPPTTLLAIPFVYGHPFNFGFLNFALGMAFVFLSFGLWLHLKHKRRYRLRAALFVVIGAAIWLTHSFAWGVLGLLCMSAETIYNHDEGDSWRRAFFNAALACLALAPPVILQLYSRGSAEGQTADWFNFQAKLLWMTTALRDRWMLWDIASLVACIAALPILRRAGFVFSRNLGITALILLATFLCLPRILFGSAYADMRLFPYVMIIALLALRPGKKIGAHVMAITFAVSALFMTLRLAGNTISYAGYNRLHQRALLALDVIPRGARVLALVGRDGGLPWSTHRMEHLSALIIVRKEGFSNDQWVMKGAQLLSVRKSDAPAFASDPSQLVRPNNGHKDLWLPVDAALARFPRDAFDYVWMIMPPDFDRTLITDLRPIWFNETGIVFSVPHSTLSGSTPRTGAAPAPLGGVQAKKLL